MNEVVEVQGARFNVRFDGPVDAPVLMLSNSLGTNLAMWEPQLEALTAHYRVLRYDSRGHGASAVTPGPYTIEQLARDVVGLLDALRVERVHFCGLSMGGMVGMWLGARAPERIDKLILCNTTPKIASPETYNTRIEKVRRDGLASVADAVLERWLSAPFRARDPASLARLRAMLVATSDEGYVASCAAVRDMDQWALLDAIRRPTLVIAGMHDLPTPPADGRRMTQAIANARYVELDAAHISNIEAAPAFTAAVIEFLASGGASAMEDRERHDNGMKVRRAVLGDTHVDRTVARRNDFNGEFQELITRYAWGEIWTRPGLPRHTRSLITIAMMVALNRADEFKLHVRAAFNNGVTRDEIKEVLMQAAIYCGVPAANTAFHLAEEVFAQMEPAPR